MKLINWLFFLLLIPIVSCEKKSSPDVPAQLIKKNDLSLMKWIEGNWVGDYQGSPFYETYEMVNDSTMKVVSYSNVNSDTASFTTDFIYWNNGTYYMGEGQRYKIVKLTETEVHMVPLQANNEVLWTYLNDSTWTAILPGKTDTAHYTLKKVSPQIDSLLISIKSIGEVVDE